MSNRLGSESFHQRVREATEAGERERHERDAQRATPLDKKARSTHPPELASCRNLLAEFKGDLRRLGIAGEDHLTSILFLALSSRVLPWEPANRPVSVLIKGTSSSGKSYTVGAVLRFFPAETVMTLPSASNLYLLYEEPDNPHSLSHRFIYVPEWTTIAEKEELVALFRVLVSEGHVVHGTVEGQGEKKARTLSKVGPTGLIMTTTSAVTDHELETRCVSVYTDDSPEQTRAIFRAIADLEQQAECPVDFERWHELQRWIGAQDNGVVVPFAQALAELMPNRSVRLRRDFTTLLCLTRSHAVLHQAQRDRDGKGRIIGTLDDYAAVRDLVETVVAEEADASVPMQFARQLRPSASS
jgi:hypothetical protein